MTHKRMVFETEQTLDWTWLLRVPVKQGEPTPMELLFLYHANTLIPLKRYLAERGEGNVAAA
jgi:hypothetical protein